MLLKQTVNIQFAAFIQVHKFATTLCLHHEEMQPNWSHCRHWTSLSEDILPPKVSTANNAAVPPPLTCLKLHYLFVCSKLNAIRILSSIFLSPLLPQTFLPTFLWWVITKWGIMPRETWAHFCHSQLSE